MKQPGCVFCTPSKIEAKIEWENAADGSSHMVFEPLRPCTPGHLLVVPVQHVSDATEDRYVAAMAMSVASRVASMHRASNILTSVGRPATQSIFHLHLHVVPRQYGDRLMLPWSEPTQSTRGGW